jgi:peptide/nickel transport system permease protein
MLIYILRRIGFIIITMFLASIIIFSVTQLLPGDVAQVVLGQFATETAINNLREELGLNLPLHIQYFHWASGFVQGDWGISLTSRMPVFPLIMGRLQNSAIAPNRPGLLMPWQSHLLNPQHHHKPQLVVF